MLYILPRDPTTSPPVSLKTLRERARREHYLIATDRTTGTFSLVDARLHRPIAGLEHIDLPSIACAIDELKS